MGFGLVLVATAPYVSHERLDLLKASGCSGSVVGLTITGWLSAPLFRPLNLPVPICE